MEDNQVTTTGMTPTPSGDQGWGKKQRIWTAFNAVIMVIIAAGILVGVNYLSSRRYFRVDCTFKQDYSLSGKTKSILKNLKEPITLYTFFIAMDRETAEIQAKITDLFEEYKIYGGKNFIVEELKPAQSPEMVEIMKKKLKMETLTPNDMVFCCGDRQKNINIIETYEREQSSPYSGEPGRIKTFKGEEAITAAILSVAQSRRPTVYFTAGHKEPDIDSPYPDNFAIINAHIKRENIDTKALKLLDKTEIPKDCHILVIAGPQEQFTAAEQQMVNSYLKSGGRAIILLDPVMQSGLEGMLKEWGVKLDDGVILDTDQCILFGGMKELSCVIANTFNRHPITSKMTDQDAGIFIMSRTVELEPGVSGGIELVKTGPKSWVEKDIEGLYKRKAKFDQGVDRQGPVSLAVAISKEVTGQPAVEQSSKKETRLVVIGDSDHLKNKFVSGDSPLYMGKIDIFMNSLRWMIGNEVMISIEPKKAESTVLELTPGKMTFLKWFSMAILPAFGALLGIAMWLMRRN
ncbi:MAG: GldG family protein [Planctomycetota bacterium]